ncbi:hypothetical protein Zm00014a_017675 [Zea mays]|uniref:Helitron helicase-like domain-containing protein n=1 Tax=Zea mays TaxID=4577 RepID=A0A3L6GB13_MAIZE|nr:hypothetical protein Zm00014a_017675 [Zea mays]
MEHVVPNTTKKRSAFTSSQRASTLQCGHFDPDFVEALKASYHARSYYGPPCYQCTHCSALFWYNERIGSSSGNRSIVYNNCCKSGKVRLPPYSPRPEPLLSLARFDGDSISKSFMQNIRQYNCLFAFTFVGAHIDRSMNDGHGPPIFKICGQIHHRIGSLLPVNDQPPKFLQLYVYDTAHEVNNRINSLSTADGPTSSIRQDIVQELSKMLDEHNPFAKKFRLARKRLNEHTNEEFIIRIIGAREGDPVQYNMPTTDDLAMLVIGDFSLDTFKRDIIIETRNSELRRISSLHPAYMALQYPLLFPYGERGFQVGVAYSDTRVRGTHSRAHITMQEYYCYQFHYKVGQPNPFLSYGTLSNQAKVDARACIDENRLMYILNNQDKLRIENLQGISDVVSKGCINGDEMGKTIVLSASHIGGRRYMIQNYHDSIAICRVHGPPDFFVTFTCNAKWLEIVDGLQHSGQKSSDAPDIPRSLIDVFTQTYASKQLSRQEGRGLRAEEGGL